MKNLERLILALSIGAGLGLTFCIVVGATMDEVGMGISLGLSIGAGLGLVSGIIINSSKNGEQQPE
jgi:ABC-type Fe3+-siderophore transport system permease subunit